MGNETTKLRVQKPPLTLQPTVSSSYNNYVNSNYDNEPTKRLNLQITNSTYNSNHQLPMEYNYSNSTPLTLSTTDSLSYSQRLGIAADQQLPQLMMNDEEIINKNQGRKSTSELINNNKRKKRIFKFNKNKTSKQKSASCASDNSDYKENTPTLTMTKSLSTSTIVASEASRRKSVARSRTRPNGNNNDNSNNNGNDAHPSVQNNSSAPYVTQNANNSHKKPKPKRGTKNGQNSMDSKKRRKSIANSKVSNGITGKYISEKIANCAALFWVQNVDTLQRKDQLEVGCMQYYHLLEQHPEVKRFFAKDKIEETALRFFDMFGWLIRSLTLDGVNLWRVLTKIGEQHSKMDIKVNHYKFLLEAFHYAMSKSFTQNYTIEIKYCIDQIFTIATCIMTGHNYDQLSFGGRVTELNDCKFLRSFNVCLDSEIGREYLYRYLGQTYCSEIVIFLQLYQEYNEIFSGHHEEKLSKAKAIASISLSRDSEFPINVSYATNEEFWARLKQCERDFDADSDNFTIDEELFDAVWDEVIKLILNNHWGGFVSSVKKMQRQQNSVLCAK